MTDNEKQPSKDDQHATDDIRQLARYQEIRKADLIREDAIQKASKAREIERTEKGAADDLKQSARYQAIRKADLAKEHAIANPQEKTNLKAKSNQQSK